MINIGLCGFGTVGSGVYKIINENVYYQGKARVSKILVHNAFKHEDIKDIITTNYLDIINDKTIDTVIECIGGTTLAYTIIKEALLNKKNVVTANKAVLIDHLIELTEIAKKNDVALYFEASVCGAINIIDTLESISSSDEIVKIEGIINGSTNFILTKAFEGLSYSESLTLAKKLGFLEADPTDDLKGYDALRKLVILSSVAYHTRIDYSKARLCGIDKLTDEVISFAKDNRYVIKFLAKSIKNDNNVVLSIEPVLIKNNNILANINNELNSIKLTTKYAKELTLIGYGAGSLPTASAIMLDINKIIDNKKHYFEFDKELVTIEDNTKSCYLINSNNFINKDLISEQLGSLYITKEVSYSQIIEELEKSKCYVKFGD